MRWCNHVSIIEHDSHWIPSLLAFWINSACDVEILVDLGHDFNICEIAFNKLLQEDNFEVAIPAFVLRSIRRRSCSVKSNVGISKLL